LFGPQFGARSLGALPWVNLALRVTAGLRAFTRPIGKSIVQTVDYQGISDTSFQKTEIEFPQVTANDRVIRIQ